MGLISEYVEVGVGGKNRKHFEDLGYKIPTYYNQANHRYMIKKGTTIQVKVSDLPTNSTVMVDLSCDNCKKPYKKKYQKYMSQNHDGKTYCKNCAMTVLNSGENNHNWKPELTDEERENFRGYPEYVEFIKRVIARDNHTCQCCGKICNHDAEVHHLDGYDWCKEKRTDETNGTCLCSMCHKAFHNKFGYGGNTKEQFEEWLGHVVDDLKKYDGILPTTRQVYCYEENKVYESAMKYILSKNNNAKTPTNVYDICNKKNGRTVYGNHLFWLDEYEKMSQEEILNIVTPKKRSYCKKVICITTGIILDSLEDGGRYYDIAKQSIYFNCRGKQRIGGKLPDGTPLQWMYYDDFLKLPIEEQNKILSRNQELSIDGSFLM